MISLVIPIYKSEQNIPELLPALSALHFRLQGELEVVFVVDGSPDRSFEILQLELPKCNFNSQLISLSRNYGAFAAVRCGLAAGKGEYFAVMAADLQEPTELIDSFSRELKTGLVDVVVAAREARVDSVRVRIFSAIAWFIYRRFIIADMPKGGIDVFGCNRVFRDSLLKLKESNTSLVGLIFWLGFRRKTISYRRLPRKMGKSSWTFFKSFRYFLDGCFSFSDLPIRMLTGAGLLGLLLALALGSSVLIGRLTASRPVPGYTMTVVLIMFFGSLNCFGLGIIGEYVRRAYENTKFRPEAIVQTQTEFKP